MSDIYEKLGIDANDHLPSVPQAAMLIGGLFCRLGGQMMIDQDGKRQILVPMAGAFARNEGEWDIYPHPVPNAKPTERFLSGDQFEGAMRMVTALLDRLHPSDRDFLFDAFASAATSVDAEKTADNLPRKSGDEQ